MGFKYLLVVTCVCAWFGSLVVTTKDVYFSQLVVLSLVFLIMVGLKTDRTIGPHTVSFRMSMAWLHVSKCKQKPQGLSVSFCNQTMTMEVRSKTMARRIEAFLVPRSGHHEMYLGLTKTTQT